MSTSSIDMESEQNEGPTNGSPMGWHVSDNRVPPNTEEDEDINYPWTDCLLNEESDENSSIDIPQNGRNIQYNDVTICENENNSVNSGTDGGNSDIGVLADFSDDDEETRVEQLSGCRIPGCQCEGRIEYMEWGSDDMTETDDSEYEDPIDRANRLYVESYNYDLSEGMTPKTYTPPLRKNRRRRYEVWKKKETEIEEYISVTSDRGFQTDKESPKSEPTVQPRTVTDEDIPTFRDKKDNRGRRRRTGCDKDISSDEDSNLFDRPVTESATAWAGSDTDNPSGEHLKCCKQPVTESVTARAPDTEEPLVMNVSTIELSELRTSVWGETDTSDIPVYKECCTPERRRPVKVSPDAHAQVVISDNQWNSRDCCFGVCKKADSVNRSGTGSCWDCLCWLVWGYHVSCLAAIVIKDRLHGIDLYTEERHVCTSRPGLQSLSTR